MVALGNAIFHLLGSWECESRCCCQDGALLCYGFATAFFIYVAVNMGMVLGLLPIVGAPLPIMSYGGSSMMAIMFGLGIVMSCKVYKDSPVN